MQKMKGRFKKTALNDQNIFSNAERNFNHKHKHHILEN